MCASYTLLREGQMITQGALEMLVSVHSTHPAIVNILLLLRRHSVMSNVKLIRSSSFK